MRRRAMWALGLGAIALALAILQAILGGRSLSLAIGAFLLAAALLGLSLFVAGPNLPRMEGLFQRPGPNQRWCNRCGHPAPKDGPCRCGAMVSRSRLFQRKQRSAAKGKKS